MDTQPIINNTPITPVGAGSSRPLEPVIPPKSSHLLPIILSSLLTALVLFGIYFLFLNKTPKIITTNSTPTPTVSTAELASADPTSTWQTYTDTIHQYLISYPATWKEENNPNVAQTNLIGREMAVSITWSQHAADDGNAGGCLTSCNFTGPDGSYNWTLLKQESDTKDNTGLIIRANIGNDNPNNRDLIDQILSTFKFTN